MVTIATGQSFHHAVWHAVKVLKYGRDSAMTPLENMVETVVAVERLRRIDCVKWNHVQVKITEIRLFFTFEFLSNKQQKFYSLSKRYNKIRRTALCRELVSRDCRISLYRLDSD